MRLNYSHPQLSQKLAQILTQQSNSISSDISPYILPFNPQKHPHNLSTLFPDYKTFILEIGSGWGEFTLALAKQLAQASINTMIIAVDKKKYRIEKSIKQQLENNITNIRWMVLDVRWFLKSIFANNTFQKIIINFPDPWPKKRHHKHRFLGTNLLNTLTHITKPNATLEFATDFYPYLASAISDLEKSPYWSNAIQPGIITRSIPNRPMSYFEKLKRLEKENIYFLQFKRNKNHIDITN